MNNTTPFDTVCRVMSDPGFYPHPVRGPERRDTHISAVFLTGDRAYKIKKPVFLGFLDFRSLPQRYFFCRQEVLLNRRLSKGVYEAVRPVYGNADQGVSFDPIGPIIDYVVCMRQLPETVRLDVMLQNNQVLPTDIELLGRRLAEFHASCDRSEQISAFGNLDTVRMNMEENFTQLSAFIARVIDPEPWHFICQVSRTFLELRPELFVHRLKTGAICDGHGDLRCEHIYMENGIQIIDCIEFNDRFRYGDAALDLAFLKMDLDYLHQSHHGRSVIDAYVKHSADFGIYGLIDFYAAYRAVVRLKIVCLKSALSGPDMRSREQQMAQRYVDLAFRYAWQFSRPTLWICCGLPATGKSRLARRLAKTYRIDLFSTDQIRNRNSRTDPGGVVPYGTGVYQLSKRNKIYREMFAAAQQVLKNGRSVVLDGTFSKLNWRAAALQLARDRDTNLIWAECVCSAKTIHKRLRRRSEIPTASDARLEHLPHMLENYRPMDDYRPDIHVRVNTERSKHQTLQLFLAKTYQMLEKQIDRRIRGHMPMPFCSYAKSFREKRTQDA